MFLFQSLISHSCSSQPASSSSLRRHVAASLMKHHKMFERNARALQPLSPASCSSSMEVMLIVFCYICKLNCLLWLADLPMGQKSFSDWKFRIAIGVSLILFIKVDICFLYAKVKFGGPNRISLKLVYGCNPNGYLSSYVFLEKITVIQ